jgi:general secretion pathway protein C
MLHAWRIERGLELALSLVVAGLVALAANATVRLALDDVPPPPAAPAAAPARHAEPLDAYAVVAARDIFNPARHDAATAAGGLRLVGVGFRGGEARAALEDTATHRQTLVGVGERVGAGRVASIAWDHVVLATGDGDAVLELAPPASRPAADAPAAPPAATAPSPTVRQTGADAYIVDRRELAGAVDNMSGLMTQLRAVAEVEDGRPAGFRLFQIDGESIFRRLGLQDGDVVQRVNGHPIGDPATLLAFLGRLRTEPRVALDIRRGGQSRTLVYDLR